MILNPYVYSSQFIPEVQSIFNAMIPAPDDYTKDIINDAVTSLKDASLWDRFDRLGIMRGLPYLQWRLLDWKNPTKSITLYGSAVCTQADGFVGSNTAGSYGDPDFRENVDGVNYQQNSSSFGFYVRAVGTKGSENMLGGGYDGSNVTDIVTSPTPQIRSRTKISTYVDYNGSFPTSDVMIVAQKEAYNLNKIYVDGSVVATGTETSSTPGGYVYLGAMYYGATPYAPTDVKESAWWTSAPFTGAEQIIIKGIMDTFFAAIVPEAIVPEAQAIFDAMTPTPSNGVKTAINHAVIRLIDGGQWSKFDRFGVMAGLPTEQHRLLDWKDATKSLTLNGAATSTKAGGFIGSHTAGAYAATGFNPATDGVNYTLNSASICAYVTHLDHHGETYGAAIAGASSVGRLTYHPDYGKYSANVNSSGEVKNNGVSAIPPTGLIAAIRYSASGALANGIYVNGVLVSNYGNDVVSSGVPNGEMYLGAWNLGGSYLSSEVNVSAWWVGGDMTGPKTLEVKNVIDEYLLSI